MSGSARCRPLERTNMVPETSNYVGCSSFSSASGCGVFATQESSTSSEKQASASSMSRVRKFYEDRGIPSKAVSVMSSWRESTSNQYELYLRKWHFLCATIQINPLCYSENYIIEFLHDLFDQNLSYSSLNTARSALSILFWNDAGMSIGCMPTIKRYMKGVFECRPPKARYTCTWDASVLLNYLLEFYPYSELSLFELTHKIVCLFALVTAQRAQTLSLLSTNSLVIDEEKCYFSLLGNIKASGLKNLLNKIEIQRFSDKKLCPVAILEHYMQRTKSLRTAGGGLFISPYKPHSAVSAATIGRWIKLLCIKLVLMWKYLRLIVHDQLRFLQLIGTE